ncbi:kallikrein-4-like, partial [Octodon degus]|uniref:Kallikrein-4-like n=1 Tax=Octodon degus TaxID=10160 RepID=A0A6P3V938_OCTDE
MKPKSKRGVLLETQRQTLGSAHFWFSLYNLHLSKWEVQYTYRILSGCNRLPHNYQIHCVLILPPGNVISSKETSSEFSDDLGPIGKFITGDSSCYPDWQPWQAALFFNNILVCSGVLVHPQWVLTAAQCWQPSYTIGLGLHRLSQPNEPGVQMIEARYSVQHPEYIGPWGGNDLMLIKLSKPAVLSSTVSTINVASTNPKSGTRCLVSGWSLLLSGLHPDNQQCVDVQVRSLNTCRPVNAYHYHNMFCASGLNNKYFDKVDSGGPVVCRGFLQGLLSWRVIPEKKNKDTALYTNLAIFRKWI